MVIDTASGQGRPILDRQLRKSNLRAVMNCDHSADPSAINDCRVSVDPKNLHTYSDDKILVIGGGGNLDGIARSHKRDGMADSSTGSGG